MNKFLNLFFTFYWWMFFTGYIEVNSGVYVVGLNSFLVEYRETTDFSVKPMWQVIVPFLGMGCAIILGISILFFFRSY
jgi:hypothetical protein